MKEVAQTDMAVTKSPPFVVMLLALLAVMLAACTQVQSTASPVDSQELTVYSGRNENLVGPIIERFEQETGIDVEVRYGDTAEMAATILEEGQNSPADVFFAQDAGALGALASLGRLQTLPEPLLDQVEPRFRDPAGRWIGASGRARVVAYNTKLAEAELPDSILGFADPRWRGRLGWAPTNGSFQAMVSAMRQLAGEDATRRWLQDMLANDVKAYDSNTAIVDAVAKGEIDVGLVNHYYLYRFLAEQGDNFPVRNYHTRATDAGALINVAGLGILDTASNRPAAERFITYLLSPAAQTYFAQETSEYPLIPDIAIDSRLKQLDQIQTPVLDLGNLEDLQGTLKLLQEVGAL
jgi:iron(III) transport system substrate-binding protein